MSIETENLKNILEAALLAYGQPLSLDRLVSLFGEEEQVSRQEIRDALQQLQQDCAERSVELVEVGSGFRYQARKDYGQWVSRLWEEKPPRYSRALLETLALVAYRQPITRAEVEDIRGVTVSSHIMKTLQERDWVRVVGHKDVPGKPALYATTKAFLDYFNLKSLDELPSLMEIRDLDKINAELDAQEGKQPPPQDSAEGDTEDNVNAEVQALADEPDERLLPDGEGDHGDGIDENDIENENNDEISGLVQEEAVIADESGEAIDAEHTEETDLENRASTALNEDSLDDDTDQAGSDWQGTVDADDVTHAEIAAASGAMADDSSEPVNPGDGYSETEIEIETQAIVDAADSGYFEQGNTDNSNPEYEGLDENSNENDTPTSENVENDYADDDPTDLNDIESEHIQNTVDDASDTDRTADDTRYESSDFEINADDEENEFSDEEQSAERWSATEPNA